MNGIILAGGKGSRMKDELPKVAQKILGKEFINYVIDALKTAGVDKIYPVVGYQKEVVLNAIDVDDYFVQEEQLGTGHAVSMAKEALMDEEGLTFVIAGDQPLITPESIKKVIDLHIKNNNHLTMLTAIMDNPFGYGRIIKDGEQVVRIVEEKDATKDEKLIKEVNISTMCFDNKMLFEYIDQLQNDNAKGEYYLTDIIELFQRDGLKIQSTPAITAEETIGINDKVDLEVATSLLKETINKKHMLNGVTIVDSSSTYIGSDVVIGKGTVIYPNSVLEGKTVIGENAKILSSYIIDSMVGDHSSVGPYSHLRAGAVIGDNNRIGNFVEVKKSILGEGVKAAHLTYIGDAEVGDKVNFGCGVVTVNYDGKNKFKTVIDSNAFIGSNVNLIAPIKVGKASKIAAGSTVYEDIPEDSLAIAREYQVNKVDYYKK